MRKTPLNFIMFCGAIIATGLILNAAGNGVFGDQVKDLAKNVTEGYGV